MAAHVAPWKKAEVKRLSSLLTESPVVAVVGVGDIPASAMQSIRAGLRGKASMRSGKNNLIHRAIDDAAGTVAGLKGLAEAVEGQTALVATDLNPFQLFKSFKASRTRAPARAGQLAPMDIEIKKGDTPFKPGPVVGELQQAGIPAAIEKGKVVIKKTSIVVAQGQVIDAKMAGALAKLEIRPIEIGLNVRAVYEDGLIYRADVLDVDEDAFTAKLNSGIRNAMGLAMETAWATPVTISPLLAKAARDALAVGIEAAFLTSETIDPILSKAYNQMLALARLASGEALDDELQAALGAAAAAAPAATSAPAEAAQEDEEPDEEQVSEEEAAEGLGALFD